MTSSRAFLRIAGAGVVLLTIVAAVIVGGASQASAHPLGNATVNHYDGLRLYPDHVSDVAVEDIAEIPTLQRKPAIDGDHDGQLSGSERARYATTQCAALAGTDQIWAGHARLDLRVTHASYSERPGAIRLRIGRLICRLNARADLSGAATLRIDDGWDSGGIGWHEITAVGSGVTLHRSPFPATSISDQLLHYPNDMLSSPLDVRGGALDVSPGAGTSTYAAATKLPVAGFAVRALNGLSTSFNNLVGSRHVTIGVGILALLLSMLLGAGHAFLPGHGKTIMAAYLVGRRGRLRDVVTVGATVTLTHTAGVLVLGLLISLTSAFAPTAAEQDLGVLSGLIVAGVGVGLLISAARHRTDRAADMRVAGHIASSDPVAVLSTQPSATVDGAMVPRQSLAEAAATTAILDPPADQAHHHDHAHAHPHTHPHDHHHSHGHAHGHAHGDEPKGFSRGGLVGLGVAGGLVPSPSALLVLLAAIALGRTAFGIVLVLGYGLGMAAALSLAGLLLVRFRGRLARVMAGRRVAVAGRLLTALPFLTAALVLVVGIGLTLRAVHGII